MEQPKDQDHQQDDVPEKDINDELTIESMFKIYDKDLDAYMDVREIMDFSEEDFKDNAQITQILKMMNENNPI